MASVVLVRGGLLALAAVSLTACIETPNGSTFSGSNVGRTVSLNGWTFTPSETIRIQVLADANADPDASGAVWTTLTTVTGAASGFNYAGDTLYTWSANVIPVPSSGVAARWPSGGLVRLRALNSDDNLLQTFDDNGCLYEGIGDGKNAGTIYNECKSHDTPVLTFVDVDPVAASSLPYLSLRETVLAEASQYNSQINAPPFFNAAGLPSLSWRSTRGFPSGEVVTRYYNKGDLGIGREMHCRFNPSGTFGSGPLLACYVTNYGSPTDGLADATTALNDAIAGHNPFATVAMDYWPLSANNKVRFYTYNAAGTLLTQAQLDTEGNKPIPGLCLSCHSGTYNASTNSVTGAKFLPFDLNAFGFASSGAFSRSGQEQAFRQLNGLLRTSETLAPGVIGTSASNLIDGWYGATGGVNTVGAVQDSAFIPSGWSGNEAIYSKAVAPYCRTCHVAVGSGTALSFDTYSDLSIYAGNIKSAVCDDKYMPHAQITRNAFWASSGRAHLVGGLNIADACN